jgi:hypothetical protein
MSTKSILLLSLLVLVSIAVIVLSSLATDELTSAFGHIRGRGVFGHFGRGPFGRFGPFGWHLAGWQGIVSVLASYTFLFLAGLLALFAFPRQLRLMRDAFGRGAGEGFRLLGIGTLGALVLVSVTALGAFAFVAFPLPFLLLAALLLAAWGGMVGLTLALGRWISHRVGLERPSPVFDLGLGTLVIFALGRIPIAGWVIVALLGALALGVIIETRFGAGGAWSLAVFEAAAEENSHE